MSRCPTLVLTAALIFLCALACSAKTVYVKWDSPGPTLDGASWASAFHTVQEGLNASLSADEVWVAKGTYVECITLTDGVGLYGGFVGAETSRDQRDFRSNETILDGNQLSSVVTSPAGATGTTRLDGFTIRNGVGKTTERFDSPCGGGICCEYSSPTIANNVITGNNVSFSGGGIYCWGSSPIITRNTFTGNHGPGYGGAIGCWENSSAVITDNLITGNGWPSVHCNTSDVLVSGNTITGDGPALYCKTASPLITSNTLTGNGVGIRLVACASPTITGNTISNNRTGIYGFSESVIIRDNIITGSDDYGGIYCEGGSAVITGNIISANATGVFCTRTSGTITGNSISDNSDGGIYCLESSPVISDNTITGNIGDMLHTGYYAFRGGGIHCTQSSPVIVGNIIRGNTAPYEGGGIHCYLSSPLITDNRIVGNGAGSLGGGIYCSSSSSPRIVHNTISRNSAQQGGGGIYVYGSNSNLLHNNIIAFNSSGIFRRTGSLTLRNNCVFGNTDYDYLGVSAGTGDISLDPLFADLANGDYHLTATSPCINAGWNDAPDLPLFDMDGEGRVFGRKVDIGADEYWSPIMSTSDARYAADGASITGQDAIVSAAFDGFFYIEAQDRSSGIRVEKPGHGFLAGDKGSITGTLKTNADGERYIEASSVMATGNGSIAAMHVTGLRLGGIDWSYTAATGAGQCGVLGGLGLNNIGLLVRTWGKVTYVGDVFFYLDDGSKLDDGSGHIGLKVALEGQTMPALNSYVKVTGISSCYKRDGNLFRLVRATEIREISRVRGCADLAVSRYTLQRAHSRLDGVSSRRLYACAGCAPVRSAATGSCTTDLRE